MEGVPLACSSSRGHRKPTPATVVEIDAVGMQTVMVEHLGMQWVEYTRASTSLRGACRRSCLAAWNARGLGSRSRKSSTVANALQPRASKHQVCEPLHTFGYFSVRLAGQFDAVPPKVLQTQFAVLAFTCSPSSNSPHIRALSSPVAHLEDTNPYL